MTSQQEFFILIDRFFLSREVVKLNIIQLAVGFRTSKIKKEPLQDQFVVRLSVKTAVEIKTIYLGLQFLQAVTKSIELLTFD